MNFFFRNLGDGRFEETALSLGVGFSEDGRPEAGMGLDFGDYDGDEALDLFVTNYELETNTLYRNLGDGTFMDTTYQSGLALPSLSWVGFGTGFFESGQRRRSRPLRRQWARHGPPSVSLGRHQLRTEEPTLRERCLSPIFR
jgi:hypothetical protein